MPHIVTLYRKVVPERVRKIIYKAFLGNFLLVIRSSKRWMKFFKYKLYYTLFPPKTEKERILKDMITDSITNYPYRWAREFAQQSFPVFIEKQNGLPYVIHQNKRLYFKREMMGQQVSDAYKYLLIEQDVRSPHRYVASYEELRGKTLVDIGAAEAIFTLDVIEYVDHAYLFECDEDWIEVLNATFAPWKEKITIVRRYVSDRDSEEYVTLDTYFKDKPVSNLFLKMDIEGFERKALQGAWSLLENSRGIAGSVCIYHLHDDEEVIKELLGKAGFSLSIQPGYLYFEEELRSAILRFTSIR